MTKSDKYQDRAEVIRYLHRSRLDPYLEATHNDQRQALNLYKWNLQLSSAFQELLSVAEVVLRNAMDHELQAWNKAKTGNSSWLLFQPHETLRRLTHSKIQTAQDLANKAAGRRDAGHRNYGNAVSHDDVLSQVMFGMWKDLLPNHVANANPNAQDNKNRVTIWNEALIQAFPNTADPDGSTTFWLVFRLHGLRNRVSHMETLLGIDAQERAKDIFNLVGAINEPTRQWLTGINRIPSVLKSRPSL